MTMTFHKKREVTRTEATDTCLFCGGTGQLKLFHPLPRKRYNGPCVCMEVEMAGSLNHITSDDGEFIGIDLIDNLGDAYEALEDCFHLIAILSGGDKDKINTALEMMSCPKIKSNLKSEYLEDNT
jgi:hypothetical protein